MLISILGNRKQKPADWWREIIKDRQGERTAHQQCEKCPDGLVHFFTVLDQRGSRAVWPPLASETSSSWEFIKGREAKEEQECTGTVNKQEHKDASQRTDAHPSLQTTRWENQGKDGRERSTLTAHFWSSTSHHLPEGPGKNKPKAALSIPSVKLGPITVFVDDKHRHSFMPDLSRCYAFSPGPKPIWKKSNP